MDCPAVLPVRPAGEELSSPPRIGSGTAAQGWEHLLLYRSAAHLAPADFDRKKRIAVLFVGLYAVSYDGNDDDEQQADASAATPQPGAGGVLEGGSRARPPLPPAFCLWRTFDGDLLPRDVPLAASEP